MFIATAIVSALFAALLAFSAYGKLTGAANQTEVLERVGALKLRPLLAALELAAAAGLLAGLLWWPLGVAAGTGAVLYFVGAVASHLRVGDRAVTSPVVLAVVAAAVTALRIATAG